MQMNRQNYGFSTSTYPRDGQLLILAITPCGAKITIEKSVKIYHHTFVWNFFNKNVHACTTQELLDQYS